MTTAELIEKLERAEAELAAMKQKRLCDHGRLLFRDDVERHCGNPDICFEYGGTVRCSPCAIKQADAEGVETLDVERVYLPEVARLNRELAAMKARGDRLAEAGKNLLSACYEADGYEELPEQIDGSLLDAMSLAIWPEIWTDEQVAALNAYQARDDSHPFTCGSDNRGDEAHRAVQDEDGGDLGQLVATRQGWICPACDYRQFWAHDFMFAQALTELRDHHHGGNDADA